LYLPYLFFHDVKIVQEPFASGGYLFPAPGRFGQCPKIGNQPSRIVVQPAAERFSRIGGRTDRLGRGEAPSVLFEALSAEQLRTDW
jgi:hypothetical protein